jgi:hypothetical protein
MVLLTAWTVLFLSLLMAASSLHGPVSLIIARVRMRVPMQVEVEVFSDSHTSA